MTYCFFPYCVAEVCLQPASLALHSPAQSDLQTGDAKKVKEQASPSSLYQVGSTRTEEALKALVRGDTIVGVLCRRRKEGMINERVEWRGWLAYQIPFTFSKHSSWLWKGHSKVTAFSRLGAARLVFGPIVWRCLVRQTCRRHVCRVDGSVDRLSDLQNTAWSRNLMLMKPWWRLKR